ncbi:hypothetical protein AC249_AIPGENE20432 [Exaiptasia diaphana]|nr:hypothetical protein AC249_AIPGENE20432 [Exaiptasia diaphana]
MSSLRMRVTRTLKGNFYMLWIINVVAGFLDLQILFKHYLNQTYVLESEDGFPDTTLKFDIWMIEAVVNPLQGFLNCLVYGQSTELTRCCRNCCRRSHDSYPNFKDINDPSSESYFINSHDALETSSTYPHYDSYRSLSSSTMGHSGTQNEKRFVARLLGEPRFT